MLKKYLLLVVMSCLSPAALFATDDFPIGIRYKFAISHEQMLSAEPFSGYGARFYEIIPALGRFVSAKDVKLKQPSFNIIADAKLLINLFANNKVRLSTQLIYSLGYSHNNYQIRYPATAPILEIDEEDEEPRNDAGTAGKIDHLTFNAMINRFELGLHVEQVHGAFWGSASFGALLYSPIHARWRRQSSLGDQIYSIMGKDSVVIHQEQAGKQLFMLPSTSEILASLSLKVGYSAFFVGMDYATNMRTHSLSFRFGVVF